MTSAMRIGLAGLGTVGGEVARLVKTQGDLLEKRAGRKIELVAVSARDRNKKRPVDLSSLAWVDKPVDLAMRNDVDVVVELMGGAEGSARQLAETALKAGKPLVTANKALLAHHGADLADLARKSGAPLYFEAAVAGGIPVIKTLRESLAGDQVEEIYGILNGTCNYILSSMGETGRSFNEVLKEAQSLGYAEADPTFDVDGMDTAHKLCILSSLAFGAPMKINVVAEGIRSITPQDIEFARELDYRIKLLGVSRLTPEGLMQHVSPYLVSDASMLAHVNGAMNAVCIRGQATGPLALTGFGAGAGPTASAVLSDIIDAAAGRCVNNLALPLSVKKVNPLPPEKSLSPFYIRMMVQDKPGVLAEITAIMRDLSISIQSLLQKGRSEAAPVPLVFITHDVSEKALADAVARVKKLPSVLEPPCVIRILP